MGLPINSEIYSYANACIQSLFHPPTVKRILTYFRGEDSLKNTFNQYISKSSVEMATLIKQLDIPYCSTVSTVKQDAALFLTSLCDKSVCLQSAYKYESNVVIRCPGCDQRNNYLSYNYIISFTLPSTTRAYTLQEIVDINIGNWHETTLICDNGCKCSKLQRVDINIKNTIVILQLLLFECNDTGEKKIFNFKINDVPRSVVTINKISYKVINAIFHEGINVKCGRYFNILRQNNMWIQVENSIIKKMRTWPKGAKNAYIFFLERI